MTSEAPVALVTGGTGQVGSVVVRFFAERGARVFVPYRTLAHWEALRASLGPLAGSVAGAQLDLGSADDAERAVTSAIERYGRLDWVLCLAGGYRPGRIAETDPALWEELLAMNLWPTANVLRAAVPRLLERGTGRIVTVGARAALDPGAGSVAYAAVKQAVMTMTLAVAREVRGTGSRPTVSRRRRSIHQRTGKRCRMRTIPSGYRVSRWLPCSGTSAHPRLLRSMGRLSRSRAGSEP